MGLKSGLSKLFGRNKDGGAESHPTLDGAHPEYKTYEGIDINLLDKIKKGDLAELQKIEAQLKARAESIRYIATKEEHALADLENKFVSSVHDKTDSGVQKEIKSKWSVSGGEKFRNKAVGILGHLKTIKTDLNLVIEIFDRREKTRLTNEIPSVVEELSRACLRSFGPGKMFQSRGVKLEEAYKSGDKEEFKKIALAATSMRNPETNAKINNIIERGYDDQWARKIYEYWQENNLVNDFWQHYVEKENSKKQEEFESQLGAKVDLENKALLFGDKEISLIPDGINPDAVDLKIKDIDEAQVLYIDYPGKKQLQIEIIADKYTAKLTDSTGAIKEQNYEGSVADLKYNLKNIVGDVNLRPGEDRLARLMREADTKKAEAWAAAKKSFEMAANATVDEVGKVLILPGGEVLPLTATDLPHTQVQYKEIDGKQCLQVAYGALHAGGVIYPLSSDIFPPQRAGENFQIRSNVGQLEKVSISLAELGEYLHKKAESASVLINEKEIEFTEAEVEDITPKSDVPPELPPELPATDTTDSGATHIDIPAVTTAQLDENAATDPDLPAVTEDDLADHVDDADVESAIVPATTPEVESSENESSESAAAEEIKQLKAELEKLKAEKASLEKEKKVSNLPDYLKAEMEDWNKLITQSYTDKKEAAASKHAHGHHTSTHHDQSGHGHAEHGSAKSGHADHVAGDHGKPHGKTHEKPHAPETIKEQELVFDHDTLYFKGKKIDFAVKGFKIYELAELSEPRLGRMIWVKPEHSKEEIYVGIALETDAENNIWKATLLVDDEKKSGMTVIHEQDTNISTPEGLTGLLKSVASYIEINKPLGELPKPPVKPDDREPDRGHGGHSDAHHDPHHSSGGGHGHGHDAPKHPELKSTPKPKAPDFPKWQEVEFGKQPVLDISSDFFFSILQKESGQESVMGKQVMDIYKKMVDSKADLVAEFANIFDDLPLTAELDEALEKQGITFEDFKEHWKKNYHQEVYAIFKKAALADQATERNLRTTQLDKIGGVQGYAKKAVLRGGIMITGASLGEGLIDEYAVDLDQFAPEVKGMVYGGLAQLTDKWLGSWWKKAAKWVGSVGEEDIANRKKAGIKRQSQELVKDLNDPKYYDYKMKSMAKWLSQGIRAASVKNAQSHENIDAHLGATDDPNLYVLRIEAAKALRAEFHEQGNEVGERLATLDVYVNSLNQAHFDSSRKKTEIQSKYQKPSLTEDSAGMKMLKTAGKIYDWAETKIKVLNGFTGAAAGVALWATSLPFRRLIWATLAAVKGSEIGDNADKQALKTRQEKEVNALLLETRKVLDSYREGIAGYLQRPDTKKVSAKKMRTKFIDTFDNANIEVVIQALARLEAVLALGVLNPALELEVQDTVHTIRKGVFFENNGDNRTFKLDLLEKETKGYGAIAEQEVKRLTERPWKWRKYLGFLAGAAAGKTFGSILGFGGK